MAIKLGLKRGRCVAVDQRWYLDVNQFAKTTPWAHGFMTAYYQRLLAPVGAGLLFLALLVVVGWWSARRHPEHEAAVIWTVLGALAALGLSQVLARARGQAAALPGLEGRRGARPAGFGLSDCRVGERPWPAPSYAAYCWPAGGDWRWSPCWAGSCSCSPVSTWESTTRRPWPGGRCSVLLVVLVLWPLVAWLLSAMVAWVGASPLGRVFSVRGAIEKTGEPVDG